MKKFIVFIYLCSIVVFGAQIKSQPTRISVAASNQVAPDCSLANIHCVGAGQEFTNIQQAVSAASSGHTVAVMSGTYSGFYINKSGTANSPIVIKAFGDVVINSGNSLSGNAIRIENANYITIDGFKVDASSFNKSNSYDYNYAGIAARGAPSAGQPMKGLKFLNCEVFGANTAGMYLSNTNGTLIEGNNLHDIKSVNDNTGMGIYLANSGSDDITVRNNKFHDNAQDGLFANGDASISGADGLVTGMIVEGNLFYGNTKNAFSFDGGQNILIRNNIFANNGKHAIRAFTSDAASGSKNIFVINNTMYNNESPFKSSEDLGGHILFNNLFIKNLSALSSGSSFVQSSNITNTDPSLFFVDAANLNFNLKAGSPAINSGLQTYQGQSAPSVDFSGDQRGPGTTVDVGADEF